VTTPETSRSAQREIKAPAQRVWDLLATPDEHHRFDGSDMVGESLTPGKLTRVGDVFTMEMLYVSPELTERYRTDNHVTVLEAPRCVEWAVAPAGKELLGWTWRYELEPSGPSSTLVTLTNDWSGTPERTMRLFGVPLVSQAQLAASLELLAAAVED
jgi:uncharacterized protein YndB with AHSA1/START domain